MILGYKPFIHLFVTNNKYHLFDVNTNSIVNISKELFAVFQEILKLEGNMQLSENTESSQKISKMISLGLLKPYPKEIEIEHPASETLADQLSKNVSFMTLQLTQNCNLRCKYCVYSGSYQNRVHTNKRMDYDTAKAAIDFLWKHSSESEKISIGFYGGEPLLEFELIKKIIPYIEQKFNGKTIEYSMTTNITAMNEEMMDYLCKNKVTILISLDGPEEVQDKNRIFADEKTGTFNVVISKIEMLIKKYPEMVEKISFNAVFDEDSDFACSNNFFMDYPTVKDFMVTGNDVSVTYRENALEYRELYYTNREYEIFKLYLACLNRYDENKVSKFVRNYNEILRENIHNRLKSTKVIANKSHPSGPCVPGIQRLFVTVDGVLLPCERVSETSEMNHIGNVYEGFDVKKADKILNVGRITKEECAKCWAFNKCTLCISTADDSGKLSASNRLAWCNSIRNSVENTLKDYCVFREYGYDFDRKKESL